MTAWLPLSKPGGRQLAADERPQAMPRLHSVFADWAAIGSAPLLLIGSALGLYDALAEGGPQTSAELAQRTGTAERYVAGVAAE